MAADTYLPWAQLMHGQNGNNNVDFLNAFPEENLFVICFNSIGSPRDRLTIIQVWISSVIVCHQPGNKSSF